MAKMKQQRYEVRHVSAEGPGQNRIGWGKGGLACSPLSQHLLPASLHRSMCCITASAMHRSCKCELACAPCPPSGCLFPSPSSSLSVSAPHPLSASAPFSIFVPHSLSFSLSSISLLGSQSLFLCPSKSLVLKEGRQSCLPGDIGQGLEHFRLSQLHEGRPGLLLNTLQCTGQHPRAEWLGPTGQECQSLHHTYVLAPIQISQLSIGAQSHTSVGLAFDHEPHHLSVNLNENAFAHLVLWAGRAGIFGGPSRMSGQPSFLTPCPSPAAGRGQGRAALEAAGSEDLGGCPP